MAKEKNTSEGLESSDLQNQLEKIADILLAKSKGGDTSGGSPHVPLSEEERAKLPKKSQDVVAEEYWIGADLKNFPWPGIHVTSDLQIFLGNVQGENALSNHIQSSVVNGSPTITSKAYAKPE